MSEMRVGIVGAGTAGLAAAALLARAGHAVEVLERAPNPGPVGAGLLLQPTGMAVLERLGVLDEVRAGAARIDRVVGTTVEGRRFMDLAYGGDARPRRAPRRAVRRRCAARRRRAGAHGAGGRRGRPAAPDPRARRRRRRALRPVRPDRRRRRRALDDAALPAVSGRGSTSTAGARCGACSRTRRTRFGGVARPVLRRRAADGGLPADRRRCRLAVLVDPARPDRRRARGGADGVPGRPAVARAGRGAADGGLRSFDQLLPAAYRQISLPRWHDGMLVLLGDAAHALSPQLGQGANLALMDAAALADAASLDEYEAARRARRGSTASGRGR